MKTIKNEMLEKMLRDPEVGSEVKSSLGRLYSDEDAPSFLQELLAGNVSYDLMHQLLSDDDEVNEAKLEQADKIFEGVKRFIESNGWHASVIDKEYRVLALGFSMQNTSLNVLIRVDANAESLSINTTLPITCLEEYRMLMGSELSKINESIRFGAFRLDEDDGEITYRFTYSIAGQDFLPDVFDRYLDCCLIIPDIHYNSIVKTATGSISNQEKIKIIGDIKKLACAINS